jgi:hypothetical protein
MGSKGLVTADTGPVAGIPEDEIDDLVRAVADLYGRAVQDPGDSRRVRAIARLWAGFGSGDAPAKVLQAMLQSIEIGYATALRDVREGAFDDDVRLWRPELFEPD